MPETIDLTGATYEVQCSVCGLRAWRLGAVVKAVCTTCEGECARTGRVQVPTMEADTERASKRYVAPRSYIKAVDITQEYRVVHRMECEW